MANISKKLYMIDASFLDENWMDLIDTMPKWRQENIKKIVAPNAKKISFLASLLYVIALRDISPCINPNDIEIFFNNANKPYIKNEQYKKIYFNISHSKDTAILSISNEEVGCDIEIIGEEMLQIAKRFFTPYEYELLKNIKDIEHQKKVFYKMWTFKESFTKYKGISIVNVLNKMDFSDIDYERIFNYKEKITPYAYQGEIYYFQNFEVNNYMISVCSKSSENFQKVIIKK